MQENFDPLQLLTNDALIARWNNDKLPTDRVSLENASIFSTAERWPLIIDPQLQGIAWIKAREERRKEEERRFMELEAEYQAKKATFEADRERRMREAEEKGEKFVDDVVLERPRPSDEKLGRLQVVRFSQNKWLDAIEKAVQDGDTVIIENIHETIDAVLNPLWDVT